MVVDDVALAITLMGPIEGTTITMNMFEQHFIIMKIKMYEFT